MRNWQRTKNGSDAIFARSPVRNLFQSCLDELLLACRDQQSSVLSPFRGCGTEDSNTFAPTETAQIKAVVCSQKPAAANNQHRRS